jgi:probable rRNA maturation factor
VAHIIDIQLAVEEVDTPDNAQLSLWVNTALEEAENDIELTIRIVDEVEATQLNEQWSDKNGPTNVLSFPAEVEDKIEPKLLGDIVICAHLVNREAREQDKTAEAHWAHMVIHGTLHLLGYDHIDDEDAEKMEAVEIDNLARLELDNPYN